MSALKKLSGQGISHKILKSFDLFNGLAPEILKEISERASIIDFAKSRVVFQEGDQDRFTYFLIKGEMTFTSANVNISFKGGSEEARLPLFDEKPRSVTAKAKSKVSVLSIETSMLDFILDNDSETIYEVSELESSNSNDWMSRFINSLTDMNIPAKNLQALMLRMKEVNVKAGDTVINQFDDDDYYYIIKQGKCIVSRKATSDGADIKLAELDEGDCFGEEALLSNAQRSATVKMQDNGSLMRLDKNDFLELLADPIINPVSYEDAVREVDAGAKFLDVRQVTDHTRDGIKGSLNMPLNVLRLRLFELDKKARYILYCDNQQKSAAAVFLMMRQGYDCAVLKGGLKDVPNNVRFQFYPDGLWHDKPSGGHDNATGVAGNIVNLHGDITATTAEAEPAAENTGKVGKLKKNVDFAVNTPVKPEPGEDPRKHLESERLKAKIANEQKELAEAEAARLKQEMEALKQQLLHQDNERQQVQQAFEQRLAQSLAQREAELLAIKEQTEKQLRQEHDRREQELLEEQVKLEQQLFEEKQQLESQLKQDLGKREQALLEEKLQLEQQLKQDLEQREQQLLELREKSEQRLKEAEEKAHQDFLLLHETAEKMQEKFLLETTELQEKKATLSQIEQELQAARDEGSRYRAEYEKLSERIESEVSRATSLDEACRLALEENERLKVEMHKAQVEAEQNLNRQVAENNERLKAELEEINNQMKDEKNRAMAAEEALRRAQQREAELRAEAEAARQAAEKDKQRLAQIQEDKLRELEEEVIRAEQAEKARREAEAMAEQLKAEAEAAKKRAEQNMHEANIAREKAESGTSKIREEIEAARRSAEQAMKKSEQAEAERRKAEMEIKKQSEVIEAIRKAEEEKERAAMSDQARMKAEQEVEKLKAKLMAQKKAALARRKVDAAEVKQAPAAKAQNETFDPYDTEQYKSTDLDVDVPNLLDQSEDLKVGAVRKSGWISDALLWETTLGLREDEESEEYLGSTQAKAVAPVVEQKAVAQKKVEENPKPVKKRNPNVSSFSAREPGQDRMHRPVAAKAPEKKAKGGKMKMIIAASVVTLLIVAGAGGYLMTVDKDADLPEPITKIINKAKDVEVAITKATKGGEGKAENAGKVPTKAAAPVAVKKPAKTVTTSQPAKKAAPAAKASQPAVATPAAATENKAPAVEMAPAEPATPVKSQPAPTPAEKAAQKEVESVINEAVTEVAEETAQVDEEIGEPAVKETATEETTSEAAE